MKHWPRSYSNWLQRTMMVGSIPTIVVVIGLAPATSAETSRSAPAKVEGAVKETELTTITLQPEAETRLGIQTSVVDQRAVRRSRVFGGEVVVPPGESVTITAPLTGRLLRPTGGRPIVGAAVQRGQELIQLWPVLGLEREILSPGDRLTRLRTSVDLEAAKVEMEGQVVKAQVAVDAARLKTERAQELRERNAGSERALDDAKAELEAARATLDSAKRRLEFLTATNVDPALAEVPALVVQSPIAGTLQQVFVAEDQLVNAGAPLFAVTNLERIWIRVPIYAGEPGRLEAEFCEVQVASVASGVLVAKRVISAPANASLSASSVDIFFEATNIESALRPGQRVMVRIADGPVSNRLTVPWSAVVFDIHGGAWVYENVQPHVFSRRRIELERVDADVAIVRRGVNLGSVVVTVGAAELYGTEFGVGK